VVIIVVVGVVVSDVEDMLVELVNM